MRIIRILQHFATKLWNIANFVMLFQAVMKILSRLLSSKFWLIGAMSIEKTKQLKAWVNLLSFAKHDSLKY
jgi:hypothetical protein